MPGRYGHVLCHVLKVWDSCKLLPKHAVTGGQEDWQVKGNVRGRHEERANVSGKLINLMEYIGSHSSRNLFRHCCPFPARTRLGLDQHRLFLSSVLPVPAQKPRLRLSTPPGSPQAFICKSKLRNLPLQSPAKLRNPRTSKGTSELWTDRQKAAFAGVMAEDGPGEMEIPVI